MPEIEANNSQDKILYQLKRLGPLSAKELGQRMQITTVGARQHLAQLAGAGLVKTLAEESVGRGRPVKRWALTEAGHGRFPDAHAQVTSDLLISVTELLGPDALDQLIEHRTEVTFAQYQAALAPQTTLAARLEALATERTREGYMAEVQEDGQDWLLIEHHCPICIAAKTCQGFCQSELEVFQRLLQDEAQVRREEHVITGARRCAYRISPLP